MLRFTPHYKAAPWGGERLVKHFGRQVPEGKIGESWELVEIDGHDSKVASGKLAGKTLGTLWRDGALGGSATGPFPFLLKWLDTRDKLSVQVHPDEAAALQLGGRAKTEAWFVAQIEADATILLGHYPGLDVATLRQAALGGTIAKWLYETRPHPGDMILVAAGTLHSVGGGCLLLEVQQPSDTTYRVYDWGRTETGGKPRDLHLDQACAAIAYARHGTPKPQKESVTGPCFAMRLMKKGTEIINKGLRVLVADHGPAILISQRGEERLVFGDVVVAEPGDGVVKIASGSCILVTEPG